MDFSVNVPALTGLPTLLDRMQEDARASAAYLDAETDINWSGEGIINILSGGHRNVQEQIRTFFETVEAGVAGPTAKTVRVSIDYYRRTELSPRATVVRHRQSGSAAARRNLDSDRCGGFAQDL